MPLAIAQQRRTSRRGSDQDSDSLGLSSLQATLKKLDQDRNRHEELVGSLATRLAAWRTEAVDTVQAHKNMSFHESGYVFVRTLGTGRHGTIKLAKKKSNAYVKHTRASVEVNRSANVVADFVAVRIVNKTEVGRNMDQETLSARESHATLLRHVQALRDLDHPNIQRVIETFEDAQHIYIVLELYTGNDLLDREEEPLDEQRVAWITNQVCSALAHAHHKGIVHQDVRPDNVHYASRSSDARCVLTDWSCCEYLNTSARDSRKHLIVTEYAAPELDPHRRTDRADLWSLGIMAFALLGFSLPFGEHGPRPQVSDFVWHDSDPQVSPTCRDFLAKLLKPEPASRMSAAEALSHPWLTQARLVHRGDRKQALKASAASSLLRFRDSSVLQRTTAALVADHISGEKLYELTQQFYVLDKSGDGFIEKADLVEALRETISAQRSRSERSMEVGEELAEDIEELMNDNSKVVALVNLMDSDGDGKITYSDFLAAAGEVSLSDCTELAWEAFRSFDRHGTGTVSKQDFKAIMDSEPMEELIRRTKSTASNPKSSAELLSAMEELGGSPLSVGQMFAAADRDHERPVTFDEFIKIVMA